MKSNPSATGPRNHNPNPSRAAKRKGLRPKDAYAVARLVDLRAPHSAVRASVEARGIGAVQDLYAHFDAMNAAHFDGKLDRPLILVTQAGSARTKGDYITRDAHGFESRIRIAPSTMFRGELYALDVLTHEMIHAWAHECDGDTEKGYRGHGPKFAAKCNEIGESLGLPRVGVKKRDELPDCAQWPVNVRPEGYYPPDTRKKAKPAAEPTDESDENERDEATDRAVEEENRKDSDRRRAAHIFGLAADLLDMKKPRAAAKRLAQARAILGGAL
jgi:hypothetical protein